jgi:hypothetical protein
MYIKISNGVVEKYPYSASELKADNPQTSFPAEISDTLLAEWGVFPVIPVDCPQTDHTQNVTEGIPVQQDGQWGQVWEVLDATQEEIAERLMAMEQDAENSRARAYRNESDPLFFKWQRGEATEQEWLDKVAEIKLRYPKP